MATVFGGPEKDVKITSSLLDLCPSPGDYCLPSSMDRAAKTVPSRQKTGFGTSTRDQFQSYLKEGQGLASPPPSTYALMPFVHGTFENTRSISSQKVVGACRLDAAGRPVSMDAKEKRLYSPSRETLMSHQPRAAKEIPNLSQAPHYPGPGKYFVGTELGGTPTLSRIKSAPGMKFTTHNRHMLKDNLQGRWREALQTPGPNNYYPTANLTFSGTLPKRRGVSLTDDKMYLPSKQLQQRGFGGAERKPFGDDVCLPKSAELATASSKKAERKSKTVREKHFPKDVEEELDLDNDKKPDGRPKTPFDAYRKPWQPKNAVGKTLFGIADRPFHARIPNTPGVGDYDIARLDQMASLSSTNAKCGYRPIVAASGGSSGQPFSVELNKNSSEHTPNKISWKVKIDDCNHAQVKEYQENVARLIKEMKNGSISLNPMDRALTPKTNQKRIYGLLDAHKPPVVPTKSRSTTSKPSNNNSYDIEIFDSTQSSTREPVVHFEESIY